jgi:DNA-binding CsgD family transcriptional regulator
VTSAKTTPDEALIDQIYEAAVLPDMWPRVLDGLAAVAGAVGGELLTSAANNLRWIGNEAGTRIVSEWFAEGWSTRNTRMPRLLALNYSGFIRGEDHFSPEELATNPEFLEFFYPRGLGVGGGTAIPVPSGDFLVFSFETLRERGPMTREALDRLDALRPHLARAALVSAQLQLERAKALAEALNIIGLPTAVLRDTGRLLAVNEKFQTLVPQVFQDRRDRVVLASRGPDDLLKAALSRLSLPGASDTSSIPLSAADDRPPLIVHVLPVRGLARDIFDRGFALVVVTPVEPKKVPTAKVIQGLFDLTPAEARIAHSIGEGNTIEVTAVTGNVSRETVRSQLKSVLSKTGLNRQNDLVSLLSGMIVPQP